MGIWNMDLEKWEKGLGTQDTEGGIWLTGYETRPTYRLGSFLINDFFHPKKDYLPSYLVSTYPPIHTYIHTCMHDK